MPEKRIFSKPPKSIEEQIALLKERSMIIENEDFAKHILKTINYYRFCGYGLYFEKFDDGNRLHQYKPDTRFENIIDYINFDTKLRRLIFEALEKIEIAFRTAICLAIANKHNDPHWFLKKEFFIDKINPRTEMPLFDHGKFLNECEFEVSRSHEIFIKSYMAKYKEPELPPCWKLAEILSMGAWSKVYSSLKDWADKRAVAELMEVSPVNLSSWIHSLSILRNFCAHHCRLWDRIFTIRPKFQGKYHQVNFPHDRLFAVLYIMNILLYKIDKGYRFSDKIKELINKYPFVDIKVMGFPAVWEESPIWKGNSMRGNK